MSKENDHKKIEFLRQALENISVYPHVMTGASALKGVAMYRLEKYHQLCLELDAEELSRSDLSNVALSNWSEPSPEQILITNQPGDYTDGVRIIGTIPSDNQILVTESELDDLSILHFSNNSPSSIEFGDRAGQSSIEQKGDE